MKRFLIRRFIFALISIVMATFAILAISRLSGDPLLLYANSGYGITAEGERVIRERLGLDKPVPYQYILWLGRTLKGDPKDPDNLTSDGRLLVLDSTNNPQFMVKYSDMWPTDLTTMQFDATPGDVDYFTAEVTFKYTIYEILNNQGQPM